MHRRDFLASSVVAGAAAVSAAKPAEGGGGRAGGPGPFKLKYAPHFGMFRNLAGDDPVEQLRFAADQGFTAWEDNGMMGRSAQEQERIGAAMAELGISMGVFVASMATAWGPHFVEGKEDSREQFLKDCRQAVEVAERVNAKWMTVVPGTTVPHLEMGYQTASVIDMLRRGAEIFEPHGLVMVLEPLNPWRDHPGMFLSKIPQAFEVCRAVDSPSCKILFDIYHQQITEGNLIPNMDLAWSEIAYFQAGDNPGRCEPGTGEINYRNVFRHIQSKGFGGIVGMEHGNSREGAEGERAVIEAYRASDDF
ncbi:MAG TPA: TIM barrel protein [Phycisphaerales bacterium]|nr:TIM barrel protein [Phycisphaerales bacterium]